MVHSTHYSNNMVIIIIIASWEVKTEKLGSTSPEDRIKREGTLGPRGPSRQWNVTQPQQGRRSCHLLPPGRTPGPLGPVKCKRTAGVQFPIGGVWGIRSRMKVGGGGAGVAGWWGQRRSLGRGKSSGDGLGVGGAHNSVGALKAAELKHVQMLQMANFMSCFFQRRKTKTHKESVTLLGPGDCAAAGLREVGRAPQDRRRVRGCGRRELQLGAGCLPLRVGPEAQARWGSLKSPEPGPFPPDIISLRSPLSPLSSLRSLCGQHLLPQDPGGLLEAAS